MFRQTAWVRPDNEFAGPERAKSPLMVSRVEWLFNLRSGDLRRGMFLALYYFLIISAYTEGQVIRDALFLGHFKAVQLPYVDFAVAAVIGGILALYIRIGRRTSLSNLVAGTLAVFLLNVVAFWWIARFERATWLYPVVYIWVGIFGVLAIAQVWTLANYALTAREAKRLFGFIGSGGILGGIFGGFFSSFLAHAFGAESLLLAMAVSLGLSIALVFTVRAQNRESFDSLASGGSMEESPRTLYESYRLVRASSHLRTIAALICICSIITSLAGWQFRAIAKEFLVQKDALAAFFGSFYGYTGALALAVQIMLTPRILRRFGVRVALLVLPIAFVGGTAALIASGALWAATLLKGTDKVLRYSIDTAALQLLYMPISPDIKIQVKSFLDTVVLRLGDGIGAMLVLTLAGGLGFTATEIGWVSLGLLILWFIAARGASRQYVTALGETLRHQRLDAERLTEPDLERSATQMLLTELRSNESSRILYALSLLETGQAKTTHGSIRQLLDHPLPEIRAKAILALRNIGDRGVVRRMEQLLRDPDLGVRTEALLFLSEHTKVDPMVRMQDLADFPDFSIEASKVAFLARFQTTSKLETARRILDDMIKDRGPDGARARLEVARLIQVLPESFASYLFQLLEDDDSQVLREAIRGTVVRGKRQFVPLLIALLGNAEVKDAAAEALRQHGENIQGSLRDHLMDPGVSLDVKREIPELLVAVAGRDARDPLTANLVQTDNILRFRIISALNKLHELYPEIELDAQIIEDALASEIMSHYRSYQVVDRMDALLGNESFSVPLRTSIDKELERIFRLLKMLHPEVDLESAFVALRSGVKSEHDIALELIETVLKPGVRRLLMPLVDTDVSLDNKVELANNLLGTTVESKDDALRVLIYTQDPWMKSCAAHLIGILGLKDFQKEVEEWADDQDPLLREKAQRACERLAAFASPA